MWPKKNGEEGKLCVELTDIAEEVKLMQTTPAQLCQEKHSKITAKVGVKAGRSMRKFATSSG